jgi:hypothetical protein
LPKNGLSIIAGIPKLKKNALGNNVTKQEFAAFKQKRPEVAVEFTKDNVFADNFSDISAETKEIFLGDIVWESARTRVESPTCQKRESNQGAYEKSLFAAAPSRLV